MVKYAIPNFREINELLKKLDVFCNRREHTSNKEEKILVDKCKFLMRDLKDYIKARFTEVIKIYAGEILRNGFVDLEVDYFE